MQQFYMKHRQRVISCVRVNLVFTVSHNYVLTESFSGYSVISLWLIVLVEDKCEAHHYKGACDMPFKKIPW